MKALIVDSSKTYQSVLASVVEKAGLEVVKAANGNFALELLRLQNFDLVCVSMFLDDMDGLVLCSNLRSDRNIGHLPILMVTSSDDRSSLVKAISLGVTEVFSKNDVDKISSYLSQFIMQHGQSEKLHGDVLYVEDSRSVAAITKALLLEHGLNVDHYTTGEAALDAFKENDYDLVLTDVVLEGVMSGYGLVREIRVMDGVKGRIPVLALSGFDDVTRKIELLRSGANDFISKPALNEELLARVSNHLVNKKLQDKIEAQQARLHDLAMKDQLTGLYNRHFLMEMAPAKLSEALRHQFSCSLIVVDADKFKNINDTHGHQAGDIVLQELSGVIADACRHEDIAARFGGEEFILFLAHCTGDDAVKKAEGLRETIEKLKPAGLRVTASFGVAEAPPTHKCDFADLFKLADEAVYEAKSSGRNKVIAGGVLPPPDAGQ